MSEVLIERYLIVAGLIAAYALAGCYIAHGQPAYAPVMKCEHRCQVLGMLV